MTLAGMAVGKRPWLREASCVDGSTVPPLRGHTVAVLGLTAVTLRAAVEALQALHLDLLDLARCRPPVDQRCKGMT